MPVIAFTRECPLPTQPIRAMLRTNLPEFSWAFEWRHFRVSQGDEPSDMEGMADILRICGRSDDTMVAMEVETRWERIAGAAPEHVWHAIVQDPVAEPPIADQLRYLVCYALTALVDEAYCRLDDDGEWLDKKALYDVVERALTATEAPVEQPAAPPASRIGRLPALVLLLDRLPQQLDGGAIARFIRMTDPEGGWAMRASETGGLIVSGRGTTINIAICAQPCPGIAFDMALSRSFWLTENRETMGAHRAHIRLDSDLDTMAADWATVRNTARVMTFLATHLAEITPSLALYNDAVGTVFGPTNCREALEVLSHGKLPISLWTWTIPVSLKAGDVSLATLGLETFMGYELESWHADLDAVQVQQRFSAILAYLFENGPAIKDGDRIGTPGATDATLCSLGQISPMQRGRDTPTLALSFRAGPAVPVMGAPVSPAEPASSSQIEGLGDTAPIFGVEEDRFDFSSFGDKAA